MAQTESKFEIRKSSDRIYFFQKGTSSDTLSKNTNDLFYLIVPDSLKNDILIQIENGQLLTTENDSLVKVRHLAGMRYEVMFVISEEDRSKQTIGLVKKNLQLKNLVNGVSQLNKESIQIKIIRKKDERPIIQNTFYYKD